MIYLHYNENTNEILGFYDDLIHEIIPTPNTKISEQEHQNALAIGATHVNLEDLSLYKKELIISEEELLKQAKEQKLIELNRWFDDMKNHSKLDLKGFGVIDSGYKYILNARAMLNNYELLPLKVFRMYDNSFKEITQTDLQNIQKAIEVAGIKIHAIKWQYEQQIELTSDLNALNELKFTDVIEVSLVDVAS